MRRPFAVAAVIAVLIILGGGSMVVPVPCGESTGVPHGRG